MEPLSEFIKSRRSIRKFLPKKVDPKRIRQLLEAARWAPSAHNSQPWRFLLFDEEEGKKRLAEAMSQAFRNALEKDKHPVETIEDQVLKSYRRIQKAPSLILVCLCKEDCRLYPDRHRNRLEEALAHQGIGAAVQNILLLAASLGLGTCWISAPLFCPRAVRKALVIPKNWDPVALIAVGHPKKISKLRTRYRLPKIFMTGRKG
jgi:F420 biosynthesis protein FbiB-like protein